MKIIDNLNELKYRLHIRSTLNRANKRELDILNEELQKTLMRFKQNGRCSGYYYTK